MPTNTKILPLLVCIKPSSLLKLISGYQSQESLLINCYLLLDGDTYSHLGWISNIDLRFGRLVFTFGITGVALCMYLEPSYFHETVTKEE